MTEYLRILDRPEIQSKEHFMLECAVANLPIDEKKYEEIIAFEIKQLSNIQKISDMFDENAELSLFTYKKLFKLVEYAGVVIDNDTLLKSFSVKAVSSENTFNISLDLMEDMQNIHGIDPYNEIWNILKSEVLKR